MILWSQCLVVSSCGYGDGSLLLTHRCEWVTVSAAVELWVTLLSVSDAVSDYDCDSADTVVVPASELISISQQLHHQLTSLMVWCSSRLTDTRCCMQLTVSQLNGWQTVMMWGSLCCDWMVADCDDVGLIVLLVSHACHVACFWNPKELLLGNPVCLGVTLQVNADKPLLNYSSTSNNWQ